MGPRRQGAAQTRLQTEAEASVGAPRRDLTEFGVSSLSWAPFPHFRGGLPPLHPHRQSDPPAHAPEVPAEGAWEGRQSPERNAGIEKSTRQAHKQKAIGADIHKTHGRPATRRSDSQLAPINFHSLHRLCQLIPNLGGWGCRRSRHTTDWCLQCTSRRRLSGGVRQPLAEMRSYALKRKAKLASPSLSCPALNVFAHLPPRELTHQCGS